MDIIKYYSDFVPPCILNGGYARLQAFTSRFEPATSIPEKKQQFTVKRMQHEKIWIKRGNRQAISPLAVGFEPNPRILRQLLDDRGPQNDRL